MVTVAKLSLIAEWSQVQLEEQKTSASRKWRNTSEVTFSILSSQQQLHSYWSPVIWKQKHRAPCLESPGSFNAQCAVTVHSPLWKYRTDQDWCLLKRWTCWSCAELLLGTGTWHWSMPGQHISALSSLCAQGIACRPTHYFWISSMSLSYQGIVFIFNWPSQFSVHWKNIKKLLHTTHIVHENCVRRRILTEFLQFSINWRCASLTVAGLHRDDSNCGGETSRVTFSRHSNSAFAFEALVVSQVKQHSLHTFPMDLLFHVRQFVFPSTSACVSHCPSAAPCESWHFTLCVPKEQSNPREGNPILSSHYAPKKSNMITFEDKLKHQVFSYERD